MLGRFLDFVLPKLPPSVAEERERRKQFSGGMLTQKDIDELYENSRDTWKLKIDESNVEEFATVQESISKEFDSLYRQVARFPMELWFLNCRVFIEDEWALVDFASWLELKIWEVRTR